MAVVQHIAVRLEVIKPETDIDDEILVLHLILDVRGKLARPVEIVVVIQRRNIHHLRLDEWITRRRIERRLSGDWL